MTAKNKLISISRYATWSAGGRGLAASGEMSVLLEYLKDDKWKVVDWSADSSNAFGRDCEMFSDEKAYFNSEYKKIKGKEFTIDANALELCQEGYGASVIKYASDFMNKYKISSMHLANIDGQLAVLYPEHKKLTKASPNSVFYQKDLLGKFIIPNVSLDSSSWKMLNGEHVPCLKELTFPEEFSFDSFHVAINSNPEDAKDFEKIAHRIKPTSISISMLYQEFDLPQKLSANYVELSNVKNKNVPDDWRVDSLSVRRCQNLVFKGGEYKTLSINDKNSNIIISHKTNVEHLALNEYCRNLAFATNVNAVSGVNKSPFYLYDRTPKDKVLVNYCSQAIIDNEVERFSFFSNYNMGRRLEDSKKIYDSLPELQRIKISESDNKSDEKYAGKSLKNLYNEASKTSGVVKADLLAMENIARSLNR